MISKRDGHVHVLPLHVANKIAAGEVVERPASVVKELVENALDAGARKIAISLTQGGRKLIAVQDDGCGMTKDDAVLSLERQATSKILDVNDIEEIDTLGFRGEAIPSIASVSRFSITTRRADSDEGIFLQVDAGRLVEVRAAGCPSGTRVEVRDLFCNVPARRKFLRAVATEEAHVKQVFTVHALAHPSVGFSLVVDNRELYRLAPAPSLADRVRELFGSEFTENLIPLDANLAAEVQHGVSVTGFIERPNLACPSRRDQYVFINGRPATAPSIAYALKEAYPRRAGESRPAAILFLELPANQVDVNVHPTKREVRFRNTSAVKTAILEALGRALRGRTGVHETDQEPSTTTEARQPLAAADNHQPSAPDVSNLHLPTSPIAESRIQSPLLAAEATPPTPEPVPLAMELPIEADAPTTRPWQWFKFLAQAASGYLLIETDAGIVTINPHAARERIAYETLLDQATKPCASATVANCSQTLLIPEIVQLPPVDFARLGQALSTIRGMGFALEEFGRDTFKVEAVPQIIGSIPPTTILGTIARDLAEGGTRRAGEHWREKLIAKSIAKSFAGAALQLSESGAVKMVEELCACRMPYVCPRGKPVMIFTSTRELDRKFDRS